jgi:phospholipase C
MINEFRKDVKGDKLPQVSFVIAPSWLSEHAHNHPQDGEALSAFLINILGHHEKVFAKTAFILNYDEGGQFYDHHWTPTPPQSDKDGKSTVTTVGELLKETQFGKPPGTPIGLGFRVPMMIISPWTRGGYVYSEVTDHTSTIKFLEKRFGIHCPNISPWRRAVTGDLTQAFNFTHPDYTWPKNLPRVADDWIKTWVECLHNPPPVVPTTQEMPV